MKYICNLDKNRNEEFVTKMSKFYNLDENLVHLLYSRGVDTQEKLNKFLNPNLTDLCDPFLFEDMQSAVDLIEQHISKNSKVLIFGDYDVDGISASAILIKYFNSVGARVSNFMPNRYEDGYGLTVATIDKIFAENKPDLVITVDCGITGIDEVEHIKSMGVDVIVTDHHEPLDELPNAIAVIDPKRKDNKYPFNQLAGVGVVFKLFPCMLYSSINLYADNNSKNMKTST